MEQERIRIMFETEMDSKVKKMTRISPDLWEIETEDGLKVRCGNYEGDGPLSVDHH